VNFPDYIQRKLAEPPPSPRHDAWRDMALQMVGEQRRNPAITDELIFDTLRAWIPDRDKPDSELRAAIRSAHHKNPEPAAIGANRAPYQRPAEQPKIKPFTPVAATEPLPDTLADVTPPEFLRRLYEPDDYVCVAFRKEDTDTVHAVSEWELLYEQNPDVFAQPDGVYFVINPSKDHESTRKDAEVADFRFCLVESDNGPKEQQFANLRNCGLPIAALCATGAHSGKSHSSRSVAQFFTIRPRYSPHFNDLRGRRREALRKPKHKTNEHQMNRNSLSEQQQSLIHRGLTLVVHRGSYRLSRVRTA
jgi:hypothetical protein